jgi:hypothetical protein
MQEIQITETAIIVIAVCITIICGLLLYKMKSGLKVKIDKSGIELDVADNEPERKELKNETIDQNLTA